MSARELRSCATTPAPPEHEPDRVIRAYLAGVDRSPIAKHLALEPEARLRQLMALQRVAAELQRAGRDARRR